MSSSRQTYIRHSFHFSRQPQQMPLSDSNCKLYLQPTVPTFDVLCNQNDARPTSMPHIATICNDAIFYRAPSTNATACSAWALERYVSPVIVFAGICFRARSSSCAYPSATQENPNHCSITVCALQIVPPDQLLSVASRVIQLLLGASYMMFTGIVTTSSFKTLARPNKCGTPLKKITSYAVSSTISALRMMDH